MEWGIPLTRPSVALVKPATTWERSLARIYFSISDRTICLVVLNPLSMKEGYYIILYYIGVVGMFTYNLRERLREHSFWVEPPSIRLLPIQLL